MPKADGVRHAKDALSTDVQLIVAKYDVAVVDRDQMLIAILSGKSIDDVNGGNSRRQLGAAQRTAQCYGVARPVVAQAVALVHRRRRLARRRRNCGG